MNKKYNYGNKTVEVKLPNSLTSAGEDKAFYDFHEGFCNCSRCEWIGGVDSLKHAVRIQSVHLLCPDCGQTVAEVSYHFEPTQISSSENVETQRVIKH